MRKHRLHALEITICLLVTPALLAAPGTNEDSDAGAVADARDDAIARGDAAWERRNEGAEGTRAAPGPAGEAVAAYEDALARDPESLEVYWKLLRALQFQGDYTTDDRELEQKIFGRGKEVAEQALDLLAQRVGGREALDAMTPEELAPRFPEPEVARIYFWATVNWGQWGQSFGKLKAARQGVGGKVRDYSQATIALDPQYEDAGGYRIHARLHTEAPKVPFFTGWIDREVAIADIRKALEIAPEEPYNLYYYADALLRFRPKEAKAKQEALGILRDLASRQPRPHNYVADFRVLEWARELLEASE